MRESLVEAFERLGISIRAASHNADQWAEAVRSLPDLRPGRRKELEMKCDICCTVIDAVGIENQS